MLASNIINAIGTKINPIIAIKMNAPKPPTYIKRSMMDARQVVISKPEIIIPQIFAIY